MVQVHSPNSPILKDCMHAFWTGGLICTVGQLILNGYQSLGLGHTDAGTATSMTMILIGALLTGVGICCRFAKLAGAGTLVPITGFANSIVSPAMEFKREGYIMGVGAKLFSLAGPVLVYGIGSSVIYGVIYWIFTRS